MVKRIRALGKEVYLIKDQKEVVQFLMKIVRANDLIITMGAGPIWKTAKEVCQLLD